MGGGEGEEQGDLAIPHPQGQRENSLVSLAHVSMAGWWQQGPVPLGAPDPMS